MSDFPDHPPEEQEAPPPPREPLVEGVDYYIENGLYVFTEHFLARRGYCCKSGCRHCPYGTKGEREGKE